MQKFFDVIPVKLVPDSDPGAELQFYFNRLRILDAGRRSRSGDQVRHDERTLDSQAINLPHKPPGAPQLMGLWFH